MGVPFTALILLCSRIGVGVAIAAAARMAIADPITCDYSQGFCYDAQGALAIGQCDGSGCAVHDQPSTYPAPAYTDPDAVTLDDGVAP